MCRAGLMACYIFCFLPSLIAQVPDVGSGHFVGPINWGPSPSQGGGNTKVSTGPSAAEIAAQQLHQEALTLNQQGLQYLNDKKWKLARDCFKTALDKWPDNQTIRDNYQKALNAIVSEEMEQKRQQQEQFDKDKRDALTLLKSINGSEEFGLKGVGSGSDLGLKGVDDTKTSNLGLKGIDDNKTLFGKGTAWSAPVDTRATGPSKLDANVPTGLPKFVEDSIPHTPAGDRMRKGMEAVLNHDWKVALAWFQDALNHQPDDAGLKRLVDLAQYTLHREGQDATSHPLTGDDAPIPDLVQSDAVHFNLAEIGATVIASQRRAEAAAKKYDAEHPGSADAAARAIIVQDAALGKGSSSEELDRQFQKALSDWQNTRDKDPQRWHWLGGPAAGEPQVITGGKG